MSLKRQQEASKCTRLSAPDTLITISSPESWLPPLSIKVLTGKYSLIPSLKPST
ncbi:hypothetical protein ElyMa_005641600, partial [Elysia marginata]